MDSELFVQNVRKLCHARGELPTIVCKKAGVGSSFISDINRGRIPSVEKFQKLADYLGVTTSELLGEKEKSTVINIQDDEPFLITHTRGHHISSDALDVAFMFDNLSQEDQEEIMAIIKLKTSRNKN